MKTYFPIISKDTYHFALTIHSLDKYIFQNDVLFHSDNKSAYKTEKVNFMLLVRIIIRNRLYVHFFYILKHIWTKKSRLQDDLNAHAELDARITIYITSDPPLIWFSLLAADECLHILKMTNIPVPEMQPV